jgi:hypothetical protein
MLSELTVEDWVLADCGSLESIRLPSPIEQLAKCRSDASRSLSMAGFEPGGKPPEFTIRFIAIEEN